MFSWYTTAHIDCHLFNVSHVGCYVRLSEMFSPGHTTLFMLPSQWTFSRIPHYPSPALRLHCNLHRCIVQDMLLNAMIIRPGSAPYMYSAVTVEPTEVFGFTTRPHSQTRIRCKTNVGIVVVLPGDRAGVTERM